MEHIICRDVPLNVTVQIFAYTYGAIPSMEMLNSLNYSLDGQADMPIKLTYPTSYGPGYYVDGNAVLSGFSNGVHNLIIYGETTIGAENKDFNATVSFTVDTSTTTIAESFPTALVIAVTVTVVAGGLL